MPIKIGKRSYRNFTSAVAAIQRKNPTWSNRRCKAYVAVIMRKQEKKGKTS